MLCSTRSQQPLPILHTSLLNRIKTTPYELKKVVNRINKYDEVYNLSKQGET